MVDLMRQEGKSLEVLWLVETHPVACEKSTVDESFDAFEAYIVADVHCFNVLSNHVTQFFHCLELTTLVSLKTNNLLADDSLCDTNPRSLCGRNDE